MHAVVLSLHTSPAAQPGAGDAGGMNVYVAHTVDMLVRAGHTVDVVTADPDHRHRGNATPSGARLHHVRTAARTKDEMGAQAAELATAMLADPELGPILRRASLIWAHYWVSGLAACHMRAQLRGDDQRDRGLGGTSASSEAAGHDLASHDPAAHTTARPALAVTFHTLAAVKDRDLGQQREPWARKDAEARIAAEADLILANSPAEAVDCRTLLGAAPDRIAVTPPGIDTRTFTPGSIQDARAALDLADADLLVLCVGRMQHVKGTDVLIDALTHLALTNPLLAGRIRAVFLGDASGETDPSGVREAAAASAAAHLIDFRPPVPAAQLAQWYRAADVVVVPSRSESFGFVAAEAASSGAAVLAARVGGLTHVVHHGETGVLVDGDDPSVWADVLAALLEDPALRAKLGARAGAESARLDWNRSEEAMLTALEACVDVNSRTDGTGTSAHSGTGGGVGGPDAEETPAPRDAAAEAPAGAAAEAAAEAAQPQAVIALIHAWAEENEVEVESVDADQIVVVLPGEKKLKTNVSIRSGRYAVEFQAFVVRRPDENRERFFQWLLKQNSRLGGLSFSVDGYDDVYLNASLPTQLLAGDGAEEVLDSYLGRFLTVADSSFNDLLILGFLTSMKREWAWRLARGESTRNLEAFRHLLDTENNEYIGTFTEQ